jgi:primase-polymerase (primpol)-like protein
MISVPAELLEYKQWVLWRKTDMNGRTTKIPISPWSGKAAACDKPQTWSSYRHVRYAMRRFRCDGVGFVFTEADPFCGIDLDQCRTADGIIATEALAVIKRLASYTELSPSGTGAHILIKAKLKGKGRRRGKIEMYDSARYFTMTGKHLGGTPQSIENRQAVLEDLANELFRTGIAFPTATRPMSLSLSDAELIERAKNARNGDLFRRLWEGDASDYGDDHSRADLALCGILGFWCQGDLTRIDRLFRGSGLMRDKWDRRTGETTYGARTIRAALRND